MFHCARLKSVSEEKLNALHTNILTWVWGENRKMQTVAQPIEKSLFQLLVTCLCIRALLPAFGGWDQTCGKLRGQTMALQLDLNQVAGQGKFFVIQHAIMVQI